MPRLHRPNPTASDGHLHTASLVPHIASLKTPPCHASQAPNRGVPNVDAAGVMREDARQASSSRFGSQNPCDVTSVTSDPTTNQNKGETDLVGGKTKNLAC